MNIMVHSSRFDDIKHKVIHGKSMTLLFILEVGL